MCRYRMLVLIAAFSASAGCAAMSIVDREQGVVKHDARPLGAERVDAEVIGKRFLQLIRGLESQDEILLARVEEAMRMQLDPVVHGRLYQAQDDVEGGWRYVMTFHPASRSKAAAARLHFAHGEGGSSNIGDICNVDFGFYHSALTNMGFHAYPSYGKRVGPVQWSYRKFNAADGSPALGVTIIRQHEPVPEAARLCVRSIAASAER